MQTNVNLLLTCLAPRKCSIVLIFPLPIRLISRGFLQPDPKGWSGLSAHLSSMGDLTIKEPGPALFSLPCSLASCGVLLKAGVLPNNY